jgi:glycine/D-amino acid oxidase-like deaminating enzyme/nitrite reductase/ring-hydroxylating ferredoxin subunit
MAVHTRSLESTSPYWADTASLPTFAKLDRDVDVDVTVVGGGITGLTAAFLLASAGREVAVLERSRFAQIDTGHTTAHLTMVTDTRLPEMVKRFGATHAQAVWDAGLAAITMIDMIVRAHDIDCDFEWIDGYLHAPDGAAGSGDARAFKQEAELAASLGFDATFVDDVPFAGGPGIRFERQARFHPRKYLAALARLLADRGVHLHEHSPVDEFCAEPRGVKTNGHLVRSRDLVIATHNPMRGLADPTAADLFQTKLALYSSYVVAGRVPRDTVPDALFWDTANPYHYLRLDRRRDHDIIIFGGEDHKTGQVTDTDACLERLERTLAARVPGVEVTHRWSGQVIETPDGLPYIGAMADGQYAATGFAGNGMTFGTLGALIISDAITGQANPWTQLFDVDRKALTKGLWDYLKENKDYPYYKMRDLVAGAESRPLRAIKRGEGAVIEHRGQQVAAYRDDKGTLTLKSAACTHMGCLVGWNRAERTWDCPCHGSRFAATGKVISGPASASLDEVGS